MTPSEQELVARPATPDDLPELVALITVTRRAAEPEMPPLRRSETEVHNFLSSRVALGEVWVATGTDQVLGVAVLTARWLHSLYVGPTHQGSGVGSLLLDVVKAQRPGGFGLWVFAANDRARGFYRRHGLIELERTDGSANDEREPDVRMVWAGDEPLTALRGWIDEVDDQLAELLARRFALTAAVQGEKKRIGEQAGHDGRDAEREREIVRRMVAHSPGLRAERLEPVMDAVITESLQDWHEHHEK